MPTPDQRDDMGNHVGEDQSGTGTVESGRAVHTKGALEIFDQGNLLILASPEAGWTVCSIVDVHSFGREDGAIHRANAERIRTCWNLHDEMLEALKEAVRIAELARLEWDRAPEGMRAGKLLIALAGGCPGYRADIDAIHAVIAKATVPKAVLSGTDSTESSLRGSPDSSEKVS